jgi:hypothetical protein
MMWELKDGLDLVRAIQSRTREFGYHVALGGGVLNRGGSDKDIDLYFHPMCNPDLKEDSAGLMNFLMSIWGKAEDIDKDYGEVEGEDEDYWAPPQEPLWHVNDDLGGALRQLVQPAQVPAWHVEYKAFKAKPRKIYKYRSKFIRGGGDRIDVFIL